MYFEGLFRMMRANGMSPTGIVIGSLSCAFTLRNIDYSVFEWSDIDVDLLDGTHPVFTEFIISRVDIRLSGFTCQTETDALSFIHKTPAKRIEFMEHCRHKYDFTESEGSFHYGDIQFYYNRGIYTCKNGSFVHFYTLEELHEYISTEYPAAIKWSTANILRFVD